MSECTIMVIATFLASSIMLCWAAVREVRLYRALIIELLKDKLWHTVKDLVELSNNSLRPIQTSMVLTELVLLRKVEKLQVEEDKLPSYRTRKN